MLKLGNNSVDRSTWEVLVVRKILFFLLILVTASMLASACGGGSGPTVQPGPNPPYNPPNDNPPADTSQDITLNGLLSYTGLLQSDEGIERTSSATPITNAGVAILNGKVAVGAAVSSETGWFEVTASQTAMQSESIGYAVGGIVVTGKT